jgi:hypothetical protein
MKLAALALACCALVAAPAAGQTRYGVTATADKDTDFSKLKSYTWDPGSRAPDRAVHAQIVAAVDRQLSSLALEKRPAAPADVIVKYGSLRRIDVDLKSKPTSGSGGRRQYDVGTLVVLLVDPATQKELYRARVDKPLEVDADKLPAFLDGVVAEMFEKYPTRKGK